MARNNHDKAAGPDEHCDSAHSDLADPHPGPTMAHHHHAPGNVVDAAGLVRDAPRDAVAQYAQDNLHAWNAIAGDWEVNQSPEVHGKADDGNDMFTQCLLPVVDELAEWDVGQTVLDLGAGSGIIARRFAKKGAHVTGLDFSHAMLEKGRARSKLATLDGSITYDFIDLMDYDVMALYMVDKERFDVITISTTLKSLPDLQPLAKALPLMLKPTGRVVVVDLHPAFSKPAGHRGMEIFEDPNTGKQQLSTYIKVPRYLSIPPSKSEAVRGQPEPLWVFHRPFWALMEPFFKQGLVLDAMREPAFHGEPVLAQAQSYHNFQQTPMLLAFRLKLLAPAT
ncbi:Ubiquinone biosynthesis O-methyltransferase [Cercospora zeina]